MNIIITKDEHFFLQNKVMSTNLIGSKLYGVNTESSDVDYLCIYNTFKDELMSGFPNIHQFQYKDVENNIDYIYTSELQFWKNFYSGDSTINVDVILFGDNEFKDEEKLKLCRTYKIIKAFIGFAKRDLKQIDEGNHKLYHAIRSLYCAESLLNNQLPRIEQIQYIYKYKYNLIHLKEFKEKEQLLRKQCNDLYDKNELLNYCIPKTGMSLIDKLYEANNTKEFHYDKS